MKKIKLDAEERDIEKNFDKLKPYPPKKEAAMKKMLQEAAKAHIKKTKDKRVTIRIYGEDLERIKVMAEEEGLPYQTFITSVLHKLSIGRLH